MAAASKAAMANDEAPEYARPGENRLYALHAT
jgi:hypothetical protein